MGALGMWVWPQAARADSVAGTPAVVQAAALPAFPDVDALAARMVTRKDLYAKIRDEALADYAKRNPQPGANDDKARAVIRLFALLWVWGDFYGEGLWKHGVEYANIAQSGGTKDPLIKAFLGIHATFGFCSNTEEDAEQTNGATDEFLASDAPPELKMWACGAVLDNLINYREQHQAVDGMPSMQARAHFVEEWGRNYRELIKQGLPHDLLYSAADGVMETVHDDEATLYLMSGELDRDYNEADPKNPVRLELDGDFYLKDAWNARGSNYANTVSDNGWKLFGDRLAEGDKILEATYALYPNEIGTCLAMMTVELGQGQGRDRMETWFQRAIKVNPNDFAAYKSKEWYLLPRWYGNVDDIMAFGQQCVDTGNWSAKLPMILTTGISESADGDPTLYQRPEIWTAVEKVYRDYLQRYPHAVFYRTSFAKHAYDSGHMDIAREQLRILGPDWDRDVLSDEEFIKITGGPKSG